MRSTIFLIFIFLSQFGLTQTNLVPNGKFNPSIYPPGSIYAAVPWYNPTIASPDFYSKIFSPPPLNTCGIPKNFVGFSYPKIDTNYIGIIIYFPNLFGDTNNIYVEYIGTPIADSLKANTCYKFSMYYSLADASVYASNKLGAFFSSYKPTSNSTTDLVLHNITPQIFVDTTTFITDTANWVELSGIYQAQGGEKYLTIGNFYTKENTKRIPVQNNFPNYFNGSPDTTFCYIYIDDVSLYEIPKPNLGGDKSVCLQNNALTIGDHTLPNQNLHWYRNDTLMSDTTNLISIHPNYTGTYILQNQGCAADTIVIHVLTNCPTPADPVPNTFTPNDDGINDAWVFSVGSASTKVICRVYNRWGNLIYQLPNTTPPHTTIHWDGRTNSGEKCSEGVYFYVIEYANYQGDAKHLKGHVSLFR